MIYTISDLHLPLGIDKPMDVFGAEWDNYVERLKMNWCSVVTNDDTVVLQGDFSWATYLEQAVRDFEFLESLPGKKILSKGNHDYWWETVTKINNYLREHNFNSVSILHNNAFFVDGVAICGNRGWTIPQATEGETYKIYSREIERLRISLAAAKALNAEEIIVFTHFPPITQGSLTNAFTNLIDEYSVKRCYYGHLHAESKAQAVQGVVHNTRYVLASADQLGFMPLRVSR